VYVAANCTHCHPQRPSSFLEGGSETFKLISTAPLHRFSRLFYSLNIHLIMSSGNSRRHHGHRHNGRSSRRTTQVSHGLIFVTDPSHSLHIYAAVAPRSALESQAYNLLLPHDSLHSTNSPSCSRKHFLTSFLTAGYRPAHRISQHASCEHSYRTLPYRACCSNRFRGRCIGIPGAYDYGMDVLCHV
jgi:hypothetical protein